MILLYCSDNIPTYKIKSWPADSTFFDGEFPMILITIQGGSRSLPLQASLPDCLWHPSWCLQQAQQQLWAAWAIHRFTRICQTGVR